MADRPAYSPLTIVVWFVAILVLCIDIFGWGAGSLFNTFFSTLFGAGSAGQGSESRFDTLMPSIVLVLTVIAWVWLALAQYFKEWGPLAVSAVSFFALIFYFQHGLGL